MIETILVGLEFDSISMHDSAYWRWYIDIPGNPRYGEWRKSRNKAKKELIAEMVVAKQSKHDVEKVKLPGAWTYGPDRYRDRNNYNG